MISGRGLLLASNDHRPEGESQGERRRAFTPNSGRDRFVLELEEIWSSEQERNGREPQILSTNVGTLPRPRQW